MAKDTEHPSFKVPADKQIKIWRYMDLPKFLSMVQHSALFLPRAHTLGDPFESTMPVANLVRARALLEARRSNPSLNYFGDIPDDRVEALYQEMATIQAKMAREHVVICWHMNAYESAAMWKIYTRANEAIAIQSTYRRLRDAMPERIYIGEIIYQDYELEPISETNGYNYIMHKRRSFEYERELRGVLWQNENDANWPPDVTRAPDGAWAKCDLTKVIEVVRVSPTAPPWFADALEGLVHRYGLSLPVRQSSLADPPLG